MANTDILTQMPSDLSPIHFRAMSSCVPASPAGSIGPSSSSRSSFAPPPSRDASTYQPVSDCQWSNVNLPSLRSRLARRLSDAAPAIAHCQRATSEGRPASLVAASTSAERGFSPVQPPGALRFPRSSLAQESSSSDATLGAKSEGLRAAVLKSRVHRCLSLRHVRDDLNAGAARRAASPGRASAGTSDPSGNAKANSDASPWCASSQKELHRCASDPVTARAPSAQDKTVLPPLPLPFDDRRAVFLPARLSCLSPRPMPAKTVNEAAAVTRSHRQDRNLPAGFYHIHCDPCQTTADQESPDVRSLLFPAIRAYPSLRIQTGSGNNVGADADESDSWLTTCIPGLEEGSPKTPATGSGQVSPQWGGQAGRRSAMKGTRSVSSSCLSSPCKRVSFDNRVEVRVFERQRAGGRVGVKTTPRSACR